MMHSRVVLVTAALLFGGNASGYALQEASSGDTVRWNESCFYYSIHEDGSDDIDHTTLEEAIRKSFDAWEDEACTYFYFEQTADATCSHVGFEQDAGNMNLLVWHEADWYVDADHSPTAIALTTLSYDDNSGRILDADIEFNGDYFSWGTDGERNLIDVQNTATHEIGHMLGLEHSSKSSATMAPTAEPGDTDKRMLDEDDVDGLCALYPLDEDPEVCKKPYCGLDNTCFSSACSAGSGIESLSQDLSAAKTGCMAAPAFGNEKNGVLALIRALVLTILH